MLSTELENLCTELQFLLEGWNAFDRVGIPLYILQMLSRGLACFRQSWNTFVHSWNAFYRVGMLSTVLVYLCIEMERFLQGWNAFDSVGTPLYRVLMHSRGLEYFLQCW
jgi:hypothetical protein